MATRWTHVVLKVSDLDRSIDFYARFCALDVVRDGRRDGGHTVWLAPRMHLVTYPVRGGEWLTPGYAMLSMLVHIRFGD